MAGGRQWEGLQREENMAVPRGQGILTGHARHPAERGVSGGGPTPTPAPQAGIPGL